jgi:TM2 domain-containing membrane protein YozV
MEAQKVDMFILTNAKFFESHQIPQIREQLLNLDDAKWLMIQTIPFKDPLTSLVISLFAGVYGVDRFYIGDIGIGIVKLITCGGFGIWTIVDWFLIQTATRNKNFESIQQHLY